MGMKLAKRPKAERNDKLKFKHSSATINKSAIPPSLLEHLPNEILYEIFAYLDFIHTYNAFLNLNTRFQNLLFYSNLPIQVNISTMSRSIFERYQKEIIIPNRHRINYLRLSNPFIVDLFFFPSCTIITFVKLEKLVLNDVHSEYLRSILMHAGALDSLHSLVITLVKSLTDSKILWAPIFRLRKLKFCKLTYNMNHRANRTKFSSMEKSDSPIEHLVLNTNLPYQLLDVLLLHLSNLRHFSIDFLLRHPHDNNSDILFTPLKHLISVSLQTSRISFNLLEQLVINLFPYAEVLRLGTGFGQEYLNAHRWERLITCSLPNLRCLDLHHDNSVRSDFSLYHRLITQFNSPFWTERGWHCVHPHTWLKDSNDGKFYSTNPCRRKYYYLGKELQEKDCPLPLQNNLQSVKYIRIFSKQLPENSVSDFPNVTELFIDHSLYNLTDSFLTDLKHLIPFKQLTKITIQCQSFSLESIVRLIPSVPNLHTITFVCSGLTENILKSVEESKIIQDISANNRIRKLIFYHQIGLNEMRFLMKLFPRMEYLVIAMKTNKLQDIFRHLFQNSSQSSHSLVYLCLYERSEIYFDDICEFIETQQFVQHYYLKCLFPYLYMWW